MVKCTVCIIKIMFNFNCGLCCICIFMEKMSKTKYFTLLLWIDVQFWCLYEIINNMQNR